MTRQPTPSHIRHLINRHCTPADLAGRPYPPPPCAVSIDHLGRCCPWLFRYRHFDYNSFVNDDPVGQQVLSQSVEDTQTGVESLYAQLVDANPSLANEPFTFDVTGGAIRVGTNADINAYPETDDWQKAIGAHTVWTSATVTVTPSDNGDSPQFTAEFTLHAEDRYNFNPGDADIETNQADAIRGRLEQVGLASQYDNYGELDRTVTWQYNDIAQSTDIESSHFR